MKYVIGALTSLALIIGVLITIKAVSSVLYNRHMQKKWAHLAKKDDANE